MSKYDKLVKAAAIGVEALVHSAPAVDAAGAVSRILKTEPRVYDLLPEDTLTVLKKVYGMAPPAAETVEGEGECQS